MTKQKIDIKNIVFLTILLLIIFCGCILRIYIWYYHTDFHYDEVCLINNIINRNYFELFGPLDYAQCSPPIFLILGKLIYSNFGVNERAICSINFSAGILSLFLFPFLTFKIFKNKFPILLANLLFATSFPLLMCSMFYKQYASDVTFSIILLLTALFIKDKQLSKLQMFFLSLFCIFCVFCSYTAGFLIFLYVLFLIFKSFKEKTIKQNLKPFLIFIIPFASVMIWYFFTNCLATINDDILQSYWDYKEGDTFFYPGSYTQIEKVVLYPIRYSYEQNLINLYYLFIIFIAATVAVLWKKNKEKLYFLFSPFVLAFVLGAFHLYPFSAERVSLYLFPFFFLIIFISIDEIPFEKYKKYIYKYAIVSLCILFFFLYLSNLLNFYIKTFENYDFSAFRFWHNGKVLPEILNGSDIKENDYLIGYENDAAILYDKKNIINKNKQYSTGYFFENEIHLQKHNNFFIWAPINDPPTEKIINWLKSNNCKIIYQIDSYYGKLTKCELMSDLKK